MVGALCVGILAQNVDDVQREKFVENDRLKY